MVRPKGGKEPQYHPDKGCVYATKFLGYQSRCLECPFPQCIEDEIYKKKLKEGL